ncbi:MAG: hypothetical protein IT443_01720 [Phycisphaeraceae bacterium]|nr:hypothetical protein [Phycisphaeraceae bacterium]
MARVQTHTVEYAQESLLRRSVDRREGFEQVLALAEHLPAEERMLMDQLFRYGLSFRQVAKLTGQKKWQVHREAEVLLRHMRSPLFRFVAGRRDLFSKKTQRVADVVVLQRRSLRQAAADTGLSLHAVRLRLRELHALALAAALGRDVKPQVETEES